MKDHKDIDDLLKKSLSTNETPSIGLNVDLKLKIENQIEEDKGISIWWIPMIISSFMGAITYIRIKSFTSPGVIQNLLIGICIVTVIFNIIMTIIGVRYFELRKGARINI